MEGRLVLKNCAVLLPQGGVRMDLALVVEGDTITCLAADADVLVRPGDWEVSCRGRLVCPGLVDLDARVAGGPAALRPPEVDAAARSDAHSDSSSDARSDPRGGDLPVSVAEVEALVGFGFAAGLRRGTSCFVEHLCVPGRASENLSAEVEAAERLGARLIGSHAGGPLPPVPASLPMGGAPLESGQAFVRDLQARPLVRGTLGLEPPPAHGDALLAQVLRAAQEHWSLGGGARRTWPPGVRIGLGTAGAGTLWTEAVLFQRSLLSLVGEGRLSTAAAEAALEEALFGAGSRLASGLFGRRLGRLEEGALADLLVVDWVPEASGFSLLSAVEALSLASVAWTIVNGRVVVREGQLLGADFLQLAADSAKARAALRARGAARTR